VGGKYGYPEERITYFYDDDDDETVDAGEAFRVMIWASDLPYPRPELSDVLECSWVIECGAGSSGELRLRDAIDPDWDIEQARTDNDLGRHVVSGAQRIVVRTTLPTTDDIVRGIRAPVLQVECASGSVSIRQIRMRAWPPGGPSGAWVRDDSHAVRSGGFRLHVSGRGELGVAPPVVDEQGFDSAGNLTGYGPRLNIQGPGRDVGWDGDGDEAFVPMVERLSDSTLPAYRYFREAWYSESGLMDGGYGFFRSLHTGSWRDFKGQLVCRLAIVEFTPHVVYEVDGSGVDPDRIYWEDASSVRDPVSGRAAMTQFHRWSSGPLLRAGSSRIQVRTFNLSGMPERTRELVRYFPGIGFITDYLVATGVPAAAAEGTDWGEDETVVPLPGGEVVAIEILPRFFKIPPASVSEFRWEGGFGLDYTSDARTIDAQHVRAEERNPSLEYFDPGLPWVEEDKPAPRFFWKDDLDRWRAIGPGKPADDPVLFKIKTAMGIYSEPRPGDEPGVGAHPLRVKVDNGYGPDSWDTPVWMEPQD
jgi:hypothetical protein